MTSIVLQTVVVAGLLAITVLLVERSLRPGPAVRFALWLVVLLKLVIPPLVAWDVGAVLPAAILRFLTPGGPAGLFLGAPDHVGSNGPGAWSANGVFAISLGQAAGLAWLLGSLAVLALATWKILRFHRRVRVAPDLPDRLQAVLEEVARSAGVVTPRAKVVDSLHGPVVWALGPPTVVVPRTLVSAGDHRHWRWVLAHEVAHIRRRDHLVVWIDLVGIVVWWWNPVLWWAHRRLRAMAELASDSCVVSCYPGNRRAYAESLLWVAGHVRRTPRVVPVLAASNRSRRLFEHRLTGIFQQNHVIGMPRRARLVLALMAVMVLPAWKGMDALPSGWIRLNGVTISLDRNARVSALRLHQNYPNPFHTGTTIPFSLEDQAFSDGAAEVTLLVFNQQGEEMSTVRLGQDPASRPLVGAPIRQAGTHEGYWDGNDRGGAPAPPGVYTMELIVEGLPPLARRLYRCPPNASADSPACGT